MIIRHLLKKAIPIVAGFSLIFGSAAGTMAMGNPPAGAYSPPGSPDIQMTKNPEHGKKQRPNKSGIGPINPAYDLDIFYNKEKHVINGQMSVTFKNNLPTDLKNVYFNLWPNADVFGENGGISISNVEVNGHEHTYNVNKTKLKISDVSIKPHQNTTVSMDFTVHVPNQQDRFGWDGQTVSLGNWFPILAVYDNEGWNLDPYYPYGEAFYSLTGKYDVSITTHKSEVIATTGREIGQPTFNGELATHHYKAFKVRDFAIEMNPNYKVQTTTVNNVKINVYYTKQHAEYVDDMLKSGHDSIALFSEKFGKYPWPELDIVSMEGWFGGMEYPQLVMISFSGDVTGPWVESVTAHEIGHQWFYGIIGNNEYDAPWLDESFASFAAALYDGNLNSLNTSAPQPDYYHLSSPVSTFTAHADEGGIGYYYYTIYDYGARTLNDLRQLLGDETFYKAIHKYFKAEKFEVATTEDFVSTMEAVSDRDLTEFFTDHRVYLNEKQ